MRSFPRSRRLLRTCFPAGREIIYLGAEKGKKASAVAPTLKTSSHCFGATSHDISGLRATRRSQHVDREIRTLWRALARERIGCARAAEGCVRDPERRRAVQFLAAGRCDRLHQDRVFFTGAGVCHPGHVKPDPQRPAIGARPLRCSINLPRSARTPAALRPRAPLSRFAIRATAAAIGLDRIPAGAPR
jgi:hypothetical protein